MQALDKEINTEERKAHQENVGIYLQPVTKPEALPRIDGKQMATAKFPEAELQAQQQDWFHEIVPDKVTRNLSRCAPPPLCAGWQNRVNVCVESACSRGGGFMEAATLRGG